MHASIDELLSLRDAEPVDAGVAAHVDGCAACATQLRRLHVVRTRLQGLPAVVSSGADGWRDVERRLEERRSLPRRRARVGLLAAAASLATLALLAGMRLQERPQPARSAFAGIDSVAAAPDTETLAELRRRSVALEELLAALPQRPAVERAATALPIESLEAQVQWVDHRLLESAVHVPPDETEELWRDRVELMNSLVRLRYIEAQRLSL
jgi:hypothetical protein